LQDGKPVEQRLTESEHPAGRLQQRRGQCHRSRRRDGSTGRGLSSFELVEPPAKWRSPETKEARQLRQPYYLRRCRAQASLISKTTIITMVATRIGAATIANAVSILQFPKRQCPETCRASVCSKTGSKIQIGPERTGTEQQVRTIEPFGDYLRSTPINGHLQSRSAPSAPCSSAHPGL
jgi:hypothetical protein